MSIKLTIEIGAPLGPDDVPVLTATTMTLIAIASSLAPSEDESEEEAASEAFVAALVHEDLVPSPCGKTDTLGRICVSEVGHRGRHLFRKVPQPLAN